MQAVINRKKIPAINGSKWRVSPTACLSTSEVSSLCILQCLRIGSQPTRHAYWLSASPHNASFLFPYPVLYHYRYVPGKDNDMYIYSTGVTCLVGSRWADNPLLSSLKLSLHFLSFFFLHRLSLLCSRHGAFIICPLTYCVFSHNDL